MPTIWIASEDSALAQTLRQQLAALGETRAGSLSRSDWRDAATPDLVVLAGLDAPPGDFGTLERALGLLSTIPQQQRAACPVLLLEARSGSPSGDLVRSRIDDRISASLAWGTTARELGERARTLLGCADLPRGLLERRRNEWISRRVERLYAGIDLQTLRAAIDPRNAERPVLLTGEPGTYKGLVAHYIHLLAEPARERLCVLPAAGLSEGRVLETLLAPSARGRVSVHLSGLDRASGAIQDEVTDLLCNSGALAMTAVRWIISAATPESLPEPLAALPWLRVDLPPLRERPDLDELAMGLARDAGLLLRSGNELTAPELGPLRELAWLGNIRELEEYLFERLSGGPVRTHAPPGSPPKGEVPAQPEPPEDQAVSEPLPQTPTVSQEPARPSGPAAGAAPPGPALPELMAPLAQEIRQPLLAIRTYASLLEQRPDDEKVRHDLSVLIEERLPQLTELLSRMERFSELGEPQPAPVDLAQVLSSELDRWQTVIRKRSLVVLRELESEAPPLLSDETQLRFALGGLLWQAIRMIPEGGDLYVGSYHHPAAAGRGARQRVLIRFHSPEEVLITPDELAGPRMPVEVILARSLIQRLGGTFAVDTSGAQDNVILIELPA